jgi:hypothetical protein
MDNDAKNYTIYNLQTGQVVARISPEGVVTDENDPEAGAFLRTLLHQEIIIREHQIEYDPEDDEHFDPYPEETMCYFDVVTLRPSDPNFLKAFARRLPYISNFGARPSY